MPPTLRNLPARATTLYLSLLLATGCATRFGTVEVPSLNESAGAHAIRKDVEYLASGKLEGRAAGTGGLEQAERYLVARFSELGLEPFAEGGSYFEPFSTLAVTGAGVRTSLAIARGEPPNPGSGPGQELLFTALGSDFVPAVFSAEGDFGGGLVFAGYCTATQGYDDFEGIDLQGRVAVCLRGWPLDGPLAEKRPAFDLRVERFKVIAARSRGAQAVVLAWPSAKAEENEPLPPMPGAVLQDDAGIPVLYVRPNLVDRALRLGGSRKTIRELARAIAGSGKPASAAYDEVQLGGQVELRRTTRKLNNVIGVLRAPGNPGEYVVVGAHYDHIGYGGELSLSEGVRRVHPGADDNASGVAAMLETARLLLPHRSELKRSVLFVGFAGEEDGMLGSTRFVESRRGSDLDDAVAMINLDMVGHLDDNGELWIVSADSAQEFPGLLERLAVARNQPLVLEGAALTGGDHVPFVTADVPALHFFTGMHEHYHRPSDRPDTLDYEGIARVAGFTAAATLMLATDPGRPRFSEAGGPPPGLAHATDVGRARGYGPWFGVVPALERVRGGGVRLRDIRADSPAEAAGLRPGDVLVKFATVDVHNLYDFAFALRNARAGEKIPVFVRRGERVQPFEVTLAERPR